MDSMEHALKWVSVFFLSMVKFIGGPLSALALGLSIWECIVVSVLGMMTSVLIVAHLGLWIRDVWKKKYTSQAQSKPTFSKKSRNLVTIWNKWGIQGVAFLTPVIFSPIIGTLVATSFGVPKRKIFIYMLASAVFWAMVLTYSGFYLKDFSPISLCTNLNPLRFFHQLQ